MRMFKKFGGVANNKYVISGARVMPVLALVAGTLTPPAEAFEKIIESAPRTSGTWYWK